MKQLIFLFFAGMFLYGCLPPPEADTFIDAPIPVAQERLCLSPLVSEAYMEQLPNWPQDPEKQKILFTAFNDLWMNLLAEFRRCQKYGLYTMVEDNENPSFRISIVLTAVELSNDTLRIPVRLQAERLRDDQRFIYTLPTTATADVKNAGSSSFHYYGQLLSCYRRNFPYRDIVSFFYRHKIERQ